MEKAKRTKPISIVHLPTSVGGNAACLSKHLNTLGIRSESWSITENQYGYQTDYIICGKTKNPIVAQLKRLLALRYILLFDAVFLNFGATLFYPHAEQGSNRGGIASEPKKQITHLYLSAMQRVELFLLRLFRKAVLIQYQGDDARQGDVCREKFEITAATQVGEDYYSSGSDRLKRGQIPLICSQCNKIYALNPDLLHVLPASAEFLPYSHISLQDWVPKYTQLEDRALHIGHAPSHRGVKGTDLIIAAVENLRKRGYGFKFVLVEGMKNDEAKAVYETLDVLVDQLYIGWYGGVAVEAMALGKPVLAYIRTNDLCFVPALMKEQLPIINTTPDTIEQSLERVLLMPRWELLALGKKSRAYVERWHDPVQIAERVRADIEQARFSRS